MENPSLIEFNHLEKEITKMITDGADLITIEKFITSKLSNSHQIDEANQIAKKEFFKVLRKNCLIKIGIGTALILIGFFITCFNFYTNKSFDLAMYGLTTVGLFFVFLGLYKLIG